MICPNSFVCETTGFNPRSLLQNTRLRVIPRVYLNSAKYLKVGKSLWVDRVFSHAVVNGMYSFHASTSAYTDFWNNSFSNIDPENSKKVSNRQIWEAFVHESVRTIAGVSGISLIIKDGLSIDHVTRGAFMQLGEDGIIHAAKDHKCAECTQPYKHTADTLSGIDSAAAVDDDEVDEAMDIDYASVRMVVMDGIVMGPTVSAIIYIYLIYFTQFFVSIVHMMIVLLNSPILVVDHSVISIKTKWEINVMCVIATT